MTGANSPGLIERALQLAPQCASVAEVKQKLKDEGYTRIDEHLVGKLTRAQIIERLLPSERPRRVR